MRILLIGASGTIGRAVHQLMGGSHEVIAAGRNGAELTVDITSPDSIQAMYRAAGKVDAVVSASGSTYFGSLQDMTPEQNEISIVSKLRGQINLVLLGLDHVRDRGSFTLTTGIVMDDPIRGGASAAMANGAIRAFVQAAALDMPRGLRINNVSPNVVEESAAKYDAFFPGFGSVPVGKVAQAFRKSIEGGQTGQTYRVYE
jgi:NAD(P)-dependent dehydrogenase (short-subunit alcohol dehydrogenase family)